ncbi:MAG: DNA mismatch repair protein MutS [Rectinemataceae bacterium]
MPERPAMMDQYRSIKARHRDAVLFFRLGDFYEMFFEDAKEASALLDLTLTKRQGVPMCGIPYHAAKPYIGRLLKAGRKVAICEQKSAPGGKGLVDRDVVEIVTPGTTVEEDFLEHGANNYLVSFCALQRHLCVAYLDASTGEFRAYSRPDEGDAETLELVRSELYRLAPRELVIQQSFFERPGVAAAVGEMEALFVERQPDWSFDAAAAADELKRRFGVASLKGFGFEDTAPELAPAAVLLRYLDDTAKTASPHLTRLQPFDRDEFLVVDESSRRNLELVRNLSDSGRRDTLLSVLDHTRTAGGSRLLRQWILQPLRDPGAIAARLDAVSFLHRDQLLLGELTALLSGVLDAERLASRVAMDKAHAKDLLALRDSIQASMEIAGLLERAGAPEAYADRLGGNAVAACIEAASIIDRGIKEDPSILLTEGNMIRDGYDAGLDRLRGLKRDSGALLEAYLQEEREASGIQGLRVRYNRIIGYFLEVSKGKLESVPAHFIRRQSLVTGERYTTVRLGELESEINGATERIVETERRLFVELREKVKSAVPSILALARLTAARDCIHSFARAATANAYVRPELCVEPILDIRRGRHPVVETCLPQGAFVPNDLSLDARDRAFALVTGPNMAGKSTVLRQTALIALMAHAGSFVPAEEARIGLIDRIFCRVGAQDNLARGESTFLVEMHETAYILNTAGPRSLVIMDEVGRGTGTLDGLSIAWAVSERLLDGVGCRTLFATHYHELTAMRHPRLVNLSMAVLENENEIVFLKRLKEGPAAGSYGIHVARLAGIPESVLSRARELQRRLSKAERSLRDEAGALSSDAAEAPADMPAVAPVSAAIVAAAAPGAASTSAAASAPAGTGELFGPEELVAARVRGLDTDRLTPLDALGLLVEFKKTLGKK